MFTKINGDFWETFERDNFSTAQVIAFREEFFGDFLFLGAFLCAQEPVGVGALEVTLQNPGSIALFVVEFSEELQPPSRTLQKSPPSDEVLQKILDSFL